jgi:hypothetical protein
MAKKQQIRDPMAKYAELIAAAKAQPDKVAETYQREQKEWERGWKEYFEEKRKELQRVGQEAKDRGEEQGAVLLTGEALEQKIRETLFEKPGFCQGCKRRPSGAIDCDEDEEEEA